MPVPAIEADEQDPPAPDESDEAQQENAAPATERFATVGVDEMDEILAGATNTHTNKMTRWGVQQIKRMTFLTSNKAEGPTQFPNV